MAATSEATRILDEVGALIRLLTRASGALEESPPLTATQRLAVYELGVDGPLRLVDLAGRLGITAPTASRAVDALVEHGLAERLPDADDRRALRIDLTPAGRVRFHERHARVTAAFEPAVESLEPSERRHLAELLARVTAELRRG
jgi:DNA-binding MarR family transcriptional regulator